MDLSPPIPPGPPPTALRSFSLTHILYDPTHPLAIPLTLLTLSPIFLFVALFTLLIFTRRLTVLALAIGQVSNEILSLYLKERWRVDRPNLRLGEGGEGYGMPSSHSQAAGFLFAWGVAYYALHARQQRRRARHPSIRAAVHGIYMFGLALWSVLVAYSRWHLNYHAPDQIYVGYGIGLLTGFAWYLVSEYAPARYPSSPLGRARAGIEWLWRGLGGVGGHGLGAAEGGWGEGWVLVGDSRDKAH